MLYEVMGIKLSSESK